MSEHNATIISDVRQLKALLDETEASLRSQRDLLKSRGMNLPPMTLQGISKLQYELSQLETSIINEQTELSQLRFLAETSALMNTEQAIDDILVNAMDVITSLTNSERGYIILRNQETKEFEFRVIHESETAPKNSGEDPQISQTILKDVLQTGQPLLTDNAYKDDRLQSGMSIAQMALRSVLCVPLMYKDQVIGVCYVDNRLRAGVFTEREKNLMMAFANQVAVAIKNISLFNEIKQSLGEISEMKELMDNVFASIGSGVVTTDDKHRIQLFNRAAEKILAQAAADAQGKKLSTVIPGVSADLDAHLMQVRRQEIAQELEAELTIKPRGRIALSMKFSPLRNSGDETSGVVMVMDDMTEKKSSEEALTLMRRYLPPQMIDNIHTISQMALGGEKREVTCVFANVRPAHTFPQNYRPQQIMEQLNQYHTRATGSIHKHNGLIDKYMGNVVMALFNTQLNPIDNHALAAVEAALSMREAFLQFYKELNIAPDPHYYHVGIHTGEATLGNVGSLNRREFSAIGDTINLAKRIEENTQAGQIIITQEAYDHILQQSDGLPAHIRLVERDPIQVKGRKQKARIYEVFKA
jgi:adenylate cyclase